MSRDHDCTCLGHGADDEELARRKAAHLALVVAPKVAEFGFSLEAVDGGGGPQMQEAFVHTVGLAERQWPELVVHRYYHDIAWTLMERLTFQM